MTELEVAAVDESGDLTRPRSRMKLYALWISVAFHMLLIGWLAVWYLPLLKTDAVVANARNTLSKQEPMPMLQEAAPSAALPPANVPDEQIKASMESQIQAASKVSDEGKLDDLNRGLERMSQVVKKESVDELVESVGRSVGVDTKMYADKAPVPGTTFNPNTAQLTSVERKAKEGGGWAYEAQMVDTNGNRATVPMTVAEGAAAYEAFEKIKAMPMAGAFYQQLVMPMLQQIVAPENTRAQGNIVVPPLSAEPASVPNADAVENSNE